MMIDKTTLGVPFFDNEYGGVYRGRQVLVTGRFGSGKSFLAYQFLGQAIANDEKAILLSNISAHDAIIVAESIGIPFASAVESGQLIILEYATFLAPLDGSRASTMLPPEAFLELQDKVESFCVRRIAFDSVLPWVEIQPVQRIAEHTYSFVHAIDRLNCTCLLTLPKPVSTPAFSLKSHLQDSCPVCISLDHKDGAERTMRVSKYLGEIRSNTTVFPFEVLPGRGIVLSGDAKEPPAPVRAPQPPPPAQQPAFRFAPAMQRHISQTPAQPAPTPQATQPPPMQQTPPQNADKSQPFSFSSVIKFPH